MYENIQKVIQQAQPVQSKLSYEEQSANYAIFSDLMKKGVKLQDLIDKANAPKEPPMDPVVFSVMEKAVSGVPEVENARKAQEDALKCVLIRLARSDAGYQKADKAYHDAVVKAYTEKGERPSGGNDVRPDGPADEHDDKTAE